MKIQIIGAGVVGFNTGQGLTQMGHQVSFYDVDTPTLMTISQKGYKVNCELQDAEIHFICVPERFLDIAVKEFAESKVRGVPVIRSTAPPGTTMRLSKEYNIHICHNPEFLREKFALWDFLVPSRILIGECCEEHGKLLEDLFKPLNTIVIRADPTTTEFSKIVDNSYFATLISFWNEVYEISQKLGVNINQVAKFSVLDRRISWYGTSFFGRPFGGTCLPKDLNQILEVAKEVNVSSDLLKAVKEVNERLKR